MSSDKEKGFDKSRPIYVSIYLKNGTTLEVVDYSLDKFKVFLEPYKAYMENGTAQKRKWFYYHSETFEMNGSNPTDSRLYIDFNDILLVKTTDKSMYM
ncbi:TPA: hypothetical protein RQJ60_004217 [Vibrio vulnificus]|uniref:hypothetical protein n=1 Tax=Vibrio vulnificus TaxID=672 RepID=UPI0028790CF5|nr:hypothetical protein [Vibrio vulnificus]MDS1833453.1 hypothetical protein [Vibrio vulnificus]HDY7589966.1 hypothetical protein [Vibrio vulnificus]